MLSSRENWRDCDVILRVNLAHRNTFRMSSTLLITSKQKRRMECKAHSGEDAELDVLQRQVQVVGVTAGSISPVVAECRCYSADPVGERFMSVQRCNERQLGQRLQQWVPLARKRKWMDKSLSSCNVSSWPREPSVTSRRYSKWWRLNILQRISLTLLMLASNVSNTQWCSPERKKHGLVLEGQAGKVDGHAGGQTPSPGLPHPSFGGRCRKAVLGVWQGASGLFGIFHSSHHHQSSWSCRRSRTQATQTSSFCPWSCKRWCWTTPYR